MSDKDKEKRIRDNIRKSLTYERKMKTWKQELNKIEVKYRFDPDEYRIRYKKFYLFMRIWDDVQSVLEMPPPAPKKEEPECE